MTRQYYPVPQIGSRFKLPIPVSFETDEVGTFSIPALGFRVRLVGNAESVVTKTVGATNDGTIAVKKVSTTFATVTVAADAAIGDEDSAAVTEVEFEATEQIKVTTAKSTAGGRALLYVTLEVLPHSDS